MDLQKGIPVTHVTNEEVLKALNTCCLCGSNLKFAHVTNFETNSVQEAAKCTECGIKSKVNTFKLQ